MAILKFFGTLAPSCLGALNLSWMPFTKFLFTVTLAIDSFFSKLSHVFDSKEPG